VTADDSTPPQKPPRPHQRLSRSHVEHTLDRVAEWVSPDAAARIAPPQRPLRGRIYRASNWFLPLTELGGSWATVRGQLSHIRGLFRIPVAPAAPTDDTSAALTPQQCAELERESRKRLWMAAVFLVAAFAFASVLPFTAGILHRINVTMTVVLVVMLALSNALYGLQYRHAARGRQITRRTLLRTPSLWT